MAGNDNLAFTDNIEEEKRSSTGEMELRMENSYSGEENKTSYDPTNLKLDTCAMIIVFVRCKIWLFFQRHKLIFRRLLHLGLHTILIAYFSAVFMVYNRKGHNVDFWNGFGLLIVLYSFFYGGLFYYFVLKKFCGSAFTEYIMKPSEKVFQFFRGKMLFRWFFCLVPVLLLMSYLLLFSSGSNRKYISLLGVVVFMALGYIFSDSPGHIKWRPVYSGLILQFLFGLLALKWETGRNILQFVGDGVSHFLGYTKTGTDFVYGPLVSEKFVSSFGTVFAFSVLPVIFFFSFFVSVLSYYNILQWGILQFSWFVQIIMGTTACESVNAAASIFLGLTESMFLYKNHIKLLTKSELHAIMCEGFSTVAGTVLAAYISFGISPSHLISASIMSSPAALSYSKLFYPEREQSRTTCENIVLTKEEGTNVLDAACRGVISSIAVVACIIANLISILAFTAFIDNILQWVGILLNFPDLSVPYLLTKLFIPVSFLMGVDTESIEDVALLVGTKTFINEFRAYEIMATMKHKFSPRTEAIATYALCGFSNFGSIGIMLGGIAALEPSQVSSASHVALRAFIAGNIVCFITACVAGTLMDS